MESGPNRSAHARDAKQFRYDMSQAIYGSFPSCAEDSMLLQNPRAESPQRAPEAPKGAKSTVPVDITFGGHDATLGSSNNDHNTPPAWLPYQSVLAGLVERMDEIHQSVCLNLSAPCDQATTTESEPWILPELDDCETDSSSSSSSTPPRSSSSSPPPPLPSAQKHYSFLFSDTTKAKAKSQLDQLRACLLQADYDGWDFFMARYSDNKRRNEALQAPHHKHQGEERLDEEFDLVVLSAVQASC